MAPRPRLLSPILPAPPSAAEQLDLFSLDEVAFNARLFAQISLPHRRPQEPELTIVNGNLTVTLVAPRDPGLPYGSYARRIIAFLVSTSVRTKSPLVQLGRTFSSFAQQLHITPTTGPRGTLPELKEQLLRVLALSIHASNDERRSPSATGHRRVEAVGFTIAARASLWWDSDNEDSPSRNGNYILLSENFFRDQIDRPIPFQLRVYVSLRSTLAQDLYLFLTYRAMRTQRLGRPESIRLDDLQHQLASTYGATKDFRKALVRSLEDVLKHYPEARVRVTTKHLVLGTYRPHVPQLLTP